MVYLYLPYVNEREVRGHRKHESSPFPVREETWQKVFREFRGITGAKLASEKSHLQPEACVALQAGINEYALLQRGDGLEGKYNALVNVQVGALLTHRLLREEAQATGDGLSSLPLDSGKNVVKDMYARLFGKRVRRDILREGLFRKIEEELIHEEIQLAMA